MMPQGRLSLSLAIEKMGKHLTTMRLPNSSKRKIDGISKTVMRPRRFNPFVRGQKSDETTRVLVGVGRSIKSVVVDSADSEMGPKAGLSMVLEVTCLSIF